MLPRPAKASATSCSFWWMLAVATAVRSAPFMWGTTARTGAPRPSRSSGPVTRSSRTSRTTTAPMPSSRPRNKASARVRSPCGRMGSIGSEAFSTILIVAVFSSAAMRASWMRVRMPRYDWSAASRARSRAARRVRRSTIWISRLAARLFCSSFFLRKESAWSTSRRWLAWAVALARSRACRAWLRYSATRLSCACTSGCLGVKVASRPSRATAAPRHFSSAARISSARGMSDGSSPANSGSSLSKSILARSARALPSALSAMTSARLNSSKASSTVLRWLSMASILCSWRYASRASSAFISSARCNSACASSQTTAASDDDRFSS